jgi:hypothetical protein
VITKVEKMKIPTKALTGEHWRGERLEAPIELAEKRDREHEPDQAENELSSRSAKPNARPVVARLRGRRVRRGCRVRGRPRLRIAEKP